MMTFRSKYWPGLMPAIILLFFPLHYVADPINIPFFEVSFMWGYLWCIILIILAASIQKDYLSFLASNLKLFYVYLFFLIGTLLISSFFANNLIHSSSRTIYALGTLGVLFTVFYIIQYFYIKNINWRSFFEISSLLFLLIIILGQIFISDWSFGEGGIRLSGGTNPNSIAFFSLYILVQTHINALLAKRWSKLQTILWTVSFSTIIWTFSRSTILTLFIIYFVYFVHSILKRMINYLKGNKIIRLKIRIKPILKLGTILVLSWIIVVNILGSDYYDYIESRLQNTENVDSRAIAWGILLNSFRENPLFGGLGWWESTEILEQFRSDGAARSSHNLFVRLLSEVGLVGLITVLALPISICLQLILNRGNIETYFKTPLAVYLFAIMLGVFSGQFFEDLYLAGVATLRNNVVIWLLSFSFITCHFSNKRILSKERGFDL